MMRDLKHGGAMHISDAMARTRPDEAIESRATRPDRIRSLLNMITAAAAVGVVAAATFTPIIASAAGHTCVSGDVCVYNQSGLRADSPTATSALWPWSAFNGGYANMNNWPPHTYNNPDTCNNIQGFAARCNLNDTISSARNRDATYKVRLFNDAHYSGSYQTVSPLTSVSQVIHNDQISSLCWNAGTVCSF